jgi:hypothetical protein
MPDDFDNLIDDLKRQRTSVERNFDDTSASQGRTQEILKKLDELRRRAGLTETVEYGPADQKR